MVVGYRLHSVIATRILRSALIVLALLSSLANGVARADGHAFVTNPTAVSDMMQADAGDQEVVHVLDREDCAPNGHCAMVCHAIVSIAAHIDGDGLLPHRAYFPAPDAPVTRLPSTLDVPPPKG